MNPNRRQLIAGAAMATLGIHIPKAFAQADGYPDRAIKMVVPYGPAGSPDVLARLLGQKLSVAMGQPFVIDNKPGANGQIGVQVAVKSPADGYTLLVADTGHLAINPALYPKIQYDVLTAFAPISMVTKTPLFLVANAAVPANNVTELLALAKKSPGKLTCGSSGNGSPHHLALALFNSMAGVEITHVPYKGVAESVPAIVGGQIDLMFVALPSVAALIQSGKLKILAVGALERSSFMPSVPTVAESGVPGYEMSSRIGLLAPAGTPKARVERLHAEVLKVLADPDTVQRMPALGMEIIGNSPQEYSDAIRTDKEKFQKIVSTVGIRID